MCGRPCFRFSWGARKRYHHERSDAVVDLAGLDGVAGLKNRSVRMEYIVLARCQQAGIGSRCNRPARDRVTQELEGSLRFPGLPGRFPLLRLLLWRILSRLFLHLAL